MRLFSLIAAAVLVGIVALTGCNSKERVKAAANNAAPSPSLQADDNVRRITPAELKAEIAKNDVVIIDVRNEVAYKSGHIKGARLIPSDKILEHINELPRDKMIVTYCS
jgi:predicted sulfurtransferase